MAILPFFYYCNNTDSRRSNLMNEDDIQALTEEDDQEEQKLHARHTFIKIDDEYKLRLDNYNITLIQHRKTNNNTYKNYILGYYRSVHDALTQIIREKATQFDQQEIITLQQYIDKLTELETWEQKIEPHVQQKVDDSISKNNYKYLLKGKEKSDD